ncbi:hypothetical protein FRB93_005151 [Tulasnella sp. JGI-2019a]|nr:hypothetical protein FRB93_005151 [Tulasnella sp. JGI-2019a]
MSHFHGFEATEDVTFSSYTSAPFRKMEYNFALPQLKTAKEYDAVDYSTLTDWNSEPRLSSIGATPIPRIAHFKTMLEPVAAFDLSDMAANGLLPKIYRDSHPDIDPNSKSPVAAALKVNSISDIHNNVFDTILAGLHYDYRIYTLGCWLDMLEQHPHGTNNQAAKMLVEQEEAFQRRWYPTPIFTNDEALGLASWLWTDARIMEALDAGHKFQQSGSVLFTYVPPWLMPRLEIQRLWHFKLNNPKPAWLSGIYAFCQQTGTRHFVLYTGDSVIGGVFDPTFEVLKLLEEVRIDVGQAGYFRYKMNDTTQQLEKLEVSLRQALIATMAEAESSEITPMSVSEAEQAAAPALSPAATPHVTRAPAVRLPSSSPPLLKRQRDDESSSSTSSPRSSPTPYIRPRSTRLTCATTHNAAAGPSRQQRAATTQAQSDEESSRPTKRTRTSPPADVAVVPAAVPVAPAAVPTVPNNPAGPIDDPLSIRRTRRQAGITYAQRQTKLADVSDSKKQADLKQKAKAVKSGPSNSKRRTIAATKEKAIDEEEDQSGDELANGGGPAVVDKPKPGVAPASKLKKVATISTKQTKKVVAVKESSKVATVKAGAKKAKAKAKAKAPAKTAVVAGASGNNDSTSPEKRYNLRDRPIPQAGPAVVSGRGGARASTTRRPPRQ